MKHYKLRVPVAVGCVAIIAGVQLAAIYEAVETRRVPVARLIASLERKLVEDPRNVQNHINLGRLHGMAFALKSDEVPAAVRRGASEEEPWYGYEPKLIPYQDRRAPSPEAAAAARDHLSKALAHYEAALELDPDNLPAQLGSGWLLDRTGEKAKAIERYRRVISQAWPVEKEKGMILPGRRFFTRETIDYLVPLLDPRADAAEISELRSRQEALDRLPRAITPIVVPLRDELPRSRVHDLSSRVRFDADGSGLRREWSWIGPDAGWLVFDADGTGSITSALQLFGSVTFWLFWENGYQALSALDDNHDGDITGSELQHLAIWRDANVNGVSDPGEVATLAAHGIVALSCSYEDGDSVRFAAMSRKGVRLANGRTRPTYDLLLRAAPLSLTMNRTLCVTC